MPNYTSKCRLSLQQWCTLAVVCVTTVFATSSVGANQEINIYSARKEQLIKPLLDRFTDATGIKVNLITGKAGALLSRLKTEGRNTPADILLTTDVGRLNQAQQAGLLQTVDSTVLQQRIPSQYRDPDNQWFGLSLRARVFVVTDAAYKGDVGAHLKNYEDLADLKWRGRVCIRSSSNVYNQSLVASLIAHNGYEKTFLWAQRLVKNFARPPTGGDRDQILAAAGGLCDIAVANTYYLAMMFTGNNAQQRTAAQNMRIIWPNSDNRGTHINISGAGLTKYSAHRDSAIALIEYLSEDDAQKWYASVNYEFPVVDGIKVSEVYAGWNDFKRDTIPLARPGKLNTEAVKLMDKAGWR